MRSMLQKCFAESTPAAHPLRPDKPFLSVIRSERSHHRAAYIVSEITETGKVQCDNTKGRAMRGNHAAPPQRANYRAKEF